MRPMSSSVAIGLTADEHEGEEGGSVDLGRRGDHGAASAGAGGPATPPRGGARVGDGHWIEQVNPRFSKLVCFSSLCETTGEAEVLELGGMRIEEWVGLATNTGWGSAEANSNFL